MARSFEEVKPEVDKHLQYLKSKLTLIVTNDKTFKALDRLDDIILMEVADQRACAIYYKSEGFCQTVMDMWRKLSKYTNKKQDPKGYRNLTALLDLNWNTSDKSREYGDELVALGFIPILLSVIKKGGLDDGLLSGPILGILHNCIRLSDNNRTGYRNANAIAVLQPLLELNNVLIQVKALIVIAYVVNENEREILATSKSGLTALLKLLKRCVANPNHKASICDSRFSGFETLDAINQLAINDTCKAEIDKQKCIPAIIRMLDDDYSEEEHRVAVEAVWTLSFMESIRASELLQSTIPTLENLAKSSSNDVQRACASALWQIKGYEPECQRPSSVGEQPPPSYQEATDDPGSTEPSTSTAKVMLSYQWDYQKRVLKIRDRLVNAGYRVWMDISNMEGDILGAMANAVENSDVILMCMSERYRDSKSCRAEASYAYKLEKKIIPLRMEPDYIPDGWLGLLQGMDLYYACYTDEELDKNMPALLKVIGENAAPNSKDTVDGPIAVPKQADFCSISPSGASAPTVPGVAEWSAEDVQNWLREKKLKCPTLDDFEGSDLVQLYTQLKDDEKAFKEEMKSGFQMDAPTCVRFIAGLKKLFV